MALFTDFKKFAFKGNVVDLAIGVVIGGAFSKIVSALVADLVMPFVALLTPSGNWRENGVILRAAADPKDNVVIKYGDFLGAILDFFIVAFALYLIVSKLVDKLESKLSQPVAPVTKPCPFCLETVPLAASRCKSCTSQLA